MVMPRVFLTHEWAPVGTMHVRFDVDEVAVLPYHLRQARIWRARSLHAALHQVPQNVPMSPEISL